MPVLIANNPFATLPCIPANPVFCQRFRASGVLKPESFAAWEVCRTQASCLTRIRYPLGNLGFANVIQGVKGPACAVSFGAIFDGSPTAATPRRCCCCSRQVRDGCAPIRLEPTSARVSPRRTRAFRRRYPRV